MEQIFCHENGKILDKSTSAHWVVQYWESIDLVCSQNDGSIDTNVCVVVICNEINTEINLCFLWLCWQELHQVQAWPYSQRCKNVPTCQQCWCKKNPILGKIFAKFYAVLSRKWVMSGCCAFWWHFLAHFGTLCYFLVFFLHYFGLLGLLLCFVAS